MQPLRRRSLRHDAAVLPRYPTRARSGHHRRLRPCRCSHIRPSRRRAPVRVTILVDAATFSHRRTVIVDRDRERMTRSLTALVEHLPATTLSVTTFSLEQQREIFHASVFGAHGLVRLNTAIAGTPQASVEVNLLRNPHGHSRKAQCVLWLGVQRYCRNNLSASLVISGFRAAWRDGARHRLGFRSRRLQAPSSPARELVLLGGLGFRQSELHPHHSCQTRSRTKTPHCSV